MGLELLVQQPLSNEDFERVLWMDRNETFIDADGDKWVRTA